MYTIKYMLKQNKHVVYSDENNFAIVCDSAPCGVPLNRSASGTCAGDGVRRHTVNVGCCSVHAFLKQSHQERHGQCGADVCFERYAIHGERRYRANRITRRHIGNCPMTA